MMNCAHGPTLGRIEKLEDFLNVLRGTRIPMIILNVIEIHVNGLLRGEYRRHRIDATEAYSPAICSASAIL